MDCIFCKIVSGDIPSYKIYEDDKVMAFLDVNPIAPGHTLIVPKEHTLDVNTIDGNTLLHIINKGKDIGSIVMNNMMADGFSLVQNNGIAQEVKHFHLHVIPKYKKNIQMSLEDVYKKMNS